MPGPDGRRFDGRRLVIASHNAGKVREIAALVAPFGVQVDAAAAFEVPEPEETGETFIANAELKARFVADATGLPALSDDSGLVVPALDGAPGIHSARWGGPSRDFGLAMERVEAALAEKAAANEYRTVDRRAHFVCALSLGWPDGVCATFEGTVHGTLVWPPRGNRGFGYDPIFVPDGHAMTFGEMDPDAKHAMSHRANAFAKLIAACFRPDPAAPDQSE